MTPQVSPAFCADSVKLEKRLGLPFPRFCSDSPWSGSGPCKAASMWFRQIADLAAGAACWKQHTHTHTSCQAGRQGGRDPESQARGDSSRQDSADQLPVRPLGPEPSRE